MNTLEKLAALIDGDETIQFEPNECHFAIMEDPDAPEMTMVFISIREDDRPTAYDDFHDDLMVTKPSWLPDWSEAECMWSLPRHITKEQAHADMIALGYNHEPKWGVL